MKCFSILTLVLTITLIISACGAEAIPPPTVGAVEIQSTAAAVALTGIAQTQSAIPTATSLPPTETITNTPPPTNTFLPVENLTLTLAPTGGVDPCENRVLPATVQGEVKVRVTNSTKATLSVSVYLQQAGPQSECGYRAYTLAPGGSFAINDLVVGCYTLWAWNPEPKDYFIVTNGTTCLNDSGPWAFDINTRDIRLR